MSQTVLRGKIRPQNGTPTETVKGKICSLLAEENEYLSSKDIEYELHLSTRQRRSALRELVSDEIVVKHQHPNDGRKVVYGLRGFWTERPPSEL